LDGFSSLILNHLLSNHSQQGYKELSLNLIRVYPDASYHGKAAVAGIWNSDGSTVQTFFMIRAPSCKSMVIGVFCPFIASNASATLLFRWIKPHGLTNPSAGKAGLGSSVFVATFFVEDFSLLSFFHLLRYYGRQLNFKKACNMIQIELGLPTGFLLRKKTQTMINSTNGCGIALRHGNSTPLKK
jgi:hypothetical protein